MRGLGSLIVLLFVLWASPAAADPILLIDPTPHTVNQGDTFSFDIFVRDAVDLFAFQFDLGFDPAFLSAISITEGAFLGTGGDTFFIPGEINNLLGAISFNANTLLDPAVGVSGNGVLATVSFMALAAGTSTISFGNVILLDTVLAEISTTTESGSVIATGAERVPEPSTWLLVGTGVALAFLPRRRRAPVRAGLSLRCRV